MLKHLKNMGCPAFELFTQSGLFIARPGQAIVESSCCTCQCVVRFLYPELERIRTGQQEILDFVQQKEEPETVYLDAEEACSRAGISESTMLRCQRRGEIAVAMRRKGKKYFRERDVERLRREYWGRE